MKNFLVYFNHVGKGLSSYVRRSTTNDPAKTVQHIIQENIQALENKMKNKIDVTVAVYTDQHINALNNVASIKLLKTDMLEQFGETRYLNSINKHISMNGNLIKLVNMREVSQNFCARSFASYCNFLFRFSLGPNGNINIFDYPVVSTLKINDASLFKEIESTTNRLNNVISSHSVLSRLPSYSKNEEPLPKIVFETSKTTKPFLSHIDYLSEQSYQTFSIHVKHLPIKMAPMIVDMLNGVLSTSLGKSSEQEVADYLVNLFKMNENDDDDDVKSQFEPNIENKNGIYLTYVHYNEDDLNSCVTLVSSNNK